MTNERQAGGSSPERGGKTLLQAREVLAQQAAEAGWEALSSVLERDSARVEALDGAAAASSLAAAFMRVARAERIELPPLEAVDPAVDPFSQISRLAQTAGIRWRKVLLESGWHQRNSGPMIAFLREGSRPVALLPGGGGKYRMIGSDGASVVVTPSAASQVGPSAAVLYRPLPHRKLRAIDLIKFSAKQNFRDLRMVLAMIVVTGLLGMLAPALSGRIYDVLIPQAEKGLMLQITVILVAAAAATSAFGFVKTMAVLRIENRVDSQLQAAIWDRLLRLPVRFFRQFTAGDLGDRAQGIEEIHGILAATGTAALLSLPVAIFNVIVMFFYSASLAVWGVLLALLGVLAAVVFGIGEILILRRQYEVRGRIAGMVLQMIAAVGKFRIANAENFAFGTWAREYVRLEKLAMKAGGWAIVSQTFFSAFSLFATAVIFAVVAGRIGPAAGGDSFTTGTFLAFSSAFGIVIGSLISTAQSSLSLLQLFPLLERTRPILDAEPEASDTRTSPGILLGEIELVDVQFGYSKDSAPVLDGISLRIRPGENLAIAGPSGGGKSTLLRLLLGFETPWSGSVIYDGKDLETLQLQEVRRQIGVVLQNAQLLAGDIFRNIVGESNLTMEDAWKAAEMAGLADDIRAMPMQMHTIISEGGGTFSGGQKQRLAIARALASRPRILFFDEATSALDNRTQAKVTESLRELRITRLVIAHRLSTIVDADRIIFLGDGQIREEGTFDELMARKGRFFELATRQIA